MNDMNKYNHLANRFEKEAQQGFNSIEGAEEYFAALKNPFIPHKASQTPAFTKYFIVVEILMVIGLLAGLKYTMLRERVLPAPQAVSVQDQISYTPSNTMPVALAIPSFVKPEPVQQEQMLPVNLMRKDSAVAILEPLPNEAPVLIEPIVKIDSLQPATPLFIYPEVSSLYKIRYVENYLVIEYTDSVKAKLEPILSGVPANIENKDKLPSEDMTMRATHTKSDNAYLAEIGTAMKSFARKDFTKAIAAFKRILKKNDADQNALFYGALCYLYQHQPSKALILLDKLDEIPNSVFKEDLDWYMAVCALQAGKTKSCENILTKISHSNSYYRAMANEKLKELNGPR